MKLEYKSVDFLIGFPFRLPPRIVFHLVPMVPHVPRDLEEFLDDGYCPPTGTAFGTRLAKMAVLYVGPFSMPTA